MATYLLLDGHSLAFRAWFALQEAGMRTSSGQETQAVYGFVTMTTKLLADFHPDGMAVAFDRSEPTFRDELAPDYKLGRPETPEPLREQIGLIREFVVALGVACLDAPGYEADDVIATLAQRLALAGDDVVVVTGDRDAFQLVADPHVKVLYNRRGVSDYVLYDEAGILERTGVPPAQYPFLAALRGDPSDNIPGVPGVGEKTAAKLVRAYGDVDNLYANLAECPPKLRENLAKFEVQVRRNLELTPAVRSVPLEFTTQDLRLGREDRQALDRLFSLLELRTPRERLYGVLDELARALGGASPEQGSAPAGSTGAKRRSLRLVVLDAEGSTLLFETLARERGTVVVEPSWSGQPGRSALEGLAVLGLGREEVAFVPGEVLGVPTARESLARLLRIGSHGERRLVVHRAKELMRALLPLGCDLTGLELDTAVAAYLVDPAEGQASLEAIAEKQGLGAPGQALPESSGGQLGFDLQGEFASRAEATGRRAELVSLLATRLEDGLDAVGARRLWEEVERPLVRVLARMEVAGIAVDRDRLKAINEELTHEAKHLEAEIHQLAGEPFNVNSTTQLRVVLYERLKLKPQRRTKTGYSTDAATLEKLRDEHPLVETLLRYREVEKLRSTYGEGLLAEVAEDGRIHASFNQTVARTGRLSSDQPNLHNIPVRTPGGRRFREAFVAPPGTSLLVADYNQIELRVIAHLSGDPGLKAAFSSGRDIHAATAAAVFGVPVSAVTPAMRARAKMVSYGLAYGMEAYGLAQRLSIPVEEATAILNQYFAAFPAVRAYMENTVVEARRRGYTETALGRRRYLPELSSDNFRVRQAAERQAMNAGIQGLAADIFKVALVRLDAAIEERHLGSRIVLQVHDELVVEAIDEEAKEIEALTLEMMRGAFPLSVPLEVNLARGPTWADAKQG
jgi:DNA polymerase-1